MRIKPKSNLFKKLYISTILFVLGRAFKSGNIDKNIKELIKELPEGFIFSIKIHPYGPKIIITKENNRFKVIRKKVNDCNIHLFIIFKNIERAFSVFSFKMSPFLCYAQNGVMVKGSLQWTMVIMGILTLLEIYLLPKFIVGRVIKRYPKWNFFYKIFNRIIIYIRILIGI